MRKRVRIRHDEPAKYVAYVLWIIGHSEATIAQVLSLRSKQVAGIIGRSEYAGRAFMSDADRREKLKELADIRIEGGAPLDGGMLDRVPFEIIPLGSGKAPGALRRRLA